MDTPDDFIEKEILKILEILDKNCDRFCVENNKMQEEKASVTRKESEAYSVKRKDA